MAEYTGFAATLSAAGAAIGQVRDISGPSMSMDTVETSNRGSAWKAYKAGLTDNGEVTFDIVFDPDLTSHKATTPGLIYYHANRSEVAWVLSFADTGATTASFTGYVKGFTPKAPMNDAQTADVTIRIMGAITWG